MLLSDSYLNTLFFTHKFWLLFFMCILLFDAFAKWRKATISFTISVCPSTSPHVTTRLTFDGFSWNLVLITFEKLSSEFKYLLKSDENNGCFVWRSVYMNDNISLDFSYNEKCLRQKLWENQKTYFMLNNFFFSKIVPLMKQCGKILYSRVGHR